jgi:hypothetical protein
MAKPTLPSFYFPTRIEGESGMTLHFLAAFDAKRGLYRFVCESQPLATVTSVAPQRCPACGQENPIRVEGTAGQHK